MIARTRETIVVTRHSGLVAYLVEQGLIDEDTPVIEHATEEDVAGRHVIGVLPMHLAALAESVTEVPLALTPADRGADLPVERVREIAGDPVTYEIDRYEPEAQRRRERQRRRRHKNETGS